MTITCVITCLGGSDDLRNDLHCVEWDVKLWYTIQDTVRTDRDAFLQMLGEFSVHCRKT